MKAFRCPPRFPVLFCLAFLVLGLFACMKQPVSQADTASSVRARLGNFTVSATKADPDNYVRPALAYKGQDLSPATDPMRELTAEQVRNDFPLPGCRSMKVEMFTGGANCCFGYYLLTSCPDAEYAAYIEPRDGGLGQAEKELRAYPADDAAFFYYEPAGQKEENRLSLSRAVSPRITRHLVFDGGTWRADRPGEFPAVYNALLAETSHNKEMDGTARAIASAYYTLMAGKNASVAERALKRALPRQYTALAPVIFADVQKAVAQFNPVRNLTVGR